MKLNLMNIIKGVGAIIVITSIGIWVPILLFKMSGYPWDLRFLHLNYHQLSLNGLINESIYILLKVSWLFYSWFFVSLMKEFVSQGKNYWRGEFSKDYQDLQQGVPLRTKNRAKIQSRSVSISKVTFLLAQLIMVAAFTYRSQNVVMTNYKYSIQSTPSHSLIIHSEENSNTLNLNASKKSSNSFEIGGLFGLSLGGAAIGEFLRLSRRRQAKRRREGQRISLPGPHLRSVHLKVSSASNEEIKFMARALAAGFKRTKICVNGAVSFGLILYPDCLEVLSCKKGDIDALKSKSLLDIKSQIVETLNSNAFDEKTDVSLPPLLALGEVAGGELFINLKYMKRILVSGLVSNVNQFMNFILIELAASTLCGDITEIVVVGKSIDFVSDFKTINICQFEDLESKLSEMTSIDLAKPRQKFEEGLKVFIVTEPKTYEVISRLNKLLPYDAILIITGDQNLDPGPDEFINLRIYGSSEQSILHAYLDQFDIRFKPNGISDTNVLDIEELIAVTRKDDVFVSEDPYRVLNQELDNAGANIACESPELMVKVLGPVEVVGSAENIEKSRTLESIVYFVMHPKGVSKELWATSLWPDQLLTRDSLNTSLWQIRKALGVGSDGAKYLLPAYTGILKLSELVSSDMFQFRVLSESTNAEDWVAALSLITGRPFDGIGEPTWLILEGYLSDIEARIVDLGLKLGALKLEQEDPKTAEFAARQSLLAVPYDERLWRLLLRATAAQGNKMALDTVMWELASVLECEDDYLSGVSNETAALYRVLSGRTSLRWIPKTT